MAAAIAKHRADREARRQAKIEARAAAQEAARLAAEKVVLADPWTQAQQVRFESALLEFTCTMDKLERWTKIAAAVGEKNKNQCIQRYKYLKDYVVQKKEIEATNVTVERF